MRSLTSKRKEALAKEEEMYEQDLSKLPKNDKRCRGLPFWHTHPAAKLLEDDIAKEMSGEREKCKPVKLQATREEYKVFPLPIFRKHIYQERTRQLSAPYWQHRRNMNGREKRETSDEILKEWSDVQINRSVEGLVNLWNGIGPDDAED